MSIQRPPVRPSGPHTSNVSHPTKRALSSTSLWSLTIATEARRGQPARGPRPEGAVVGGAGRGQEGENYAAPRVRNESHRGEPCFATASRGGRRQDGESGVVVVPRVGGGGLVSVRGGLRWRVPGIVPVLSHMNRLCVSEVWFLASGPGWGTSVAGSVFFVLCDEGGASVLHVPAPISRFLSARLFCM